MERSGPEAIAELACAEVDAAVFEGRVLERIVHQIGADVGFFAGAEGVSQAAIGLDDGVRPEAQRHWSSMSEEVRVLMRAARRTGGVVVDSEVLGDRLERQLYYDVLMRPHRGRTTLMGFLTYQGRCFGELVLGRSRGSPAFQPRDVEALRALVPTLSLALHGYGRAALYATGAGPASKHALTAREREVLGYLHLGYTNAQIAQALGSAPNTVRNQLSRVYEKLGVASRAEAVGLARAGRVR